MLELEQVLGQPGQLSNNLSEDKKVFFKKMTRDLPNGRVLA